MNTAIQVAQASRESVACRRNHNRGTEDSGVKKHWCDYHWSAELLKMLANEHRPIVLVALIWGPLTLGEIHKFIPHITATALSRHLNQLKTED